MAEFVEPNVSTLKVQVYVDSEGIITSTNISKKRLRQVDGFKVDGTLEEAIAVLDFMFGSGTYDVKSIKRITVYKVDSGEIIEVEFYSSDIAPIFAGTYQPSGSKFTYDDLTPLFTGTYQLSGRNKFTAEDINF